VPNSSGFEGMLLRPRQLKSQAEELETGSETARGTRHNEIQLATGAPLRLEVIHEIPEQSSLREQWNALAFRSEQPQVFYTYEWALAVQRAYSSRLKPLLFLARDRNDSLSGIAALATDCSGKGASFLCATTGDYCDFLSLPEHRDTFVRLVLAELKRSAVRETVFTNLPADSATVMALKKGSRLCRFLIFARPAYLCAQISLARLDRRKDDNSILPRKKMLRRFLNVMGREHPVELEHCRSWNRIEPMLAEFMRSHVARFLANGRISNTVRPDRRTFFVELAKLLSAQGWLALTRMTSGDRVLAWNYGFQFRGTWFWYQPTFDMKLEKYSPGYCLLAKLVEEAAADPIFHTVDLGLGAEEYKDRFANQVRATLWISLTSSVVHHASAILRYRVGEAINKRPKAEKFIRSRLQLYRTFQRRLGEFGVLQAFSWGCKRVLGAVARRDDILFYELSGWSPQASPRADVSLERIDLNLLAAAAMQESDDEDTLSYLIRCARRLRSDSKAEGYALADGNRRFLHFVWIHPFEGFYFSELNGSVPSPSSDSVILFDCRTPASQRGRGFYGEAITLIAAKMREEGKRAWIFSASSNTSSVRGLERTGLRSWFCAIRYRFLGWQRIVQRNAA
jgi:CelD/BcsL family acetyltransferase involved in cellulose biosynthesis